MNRSDENVGERLRVARELLKEFTVERYSNIFIFWAAFLLLAIIALRMIFTSSNNDLGNLGGIIGSGGAITASCGRLMSVFNKVLNAVFGQPKG